MAANVTVLSGYKSPSHNYGSLPHGTAVLGIMVMADNNIGGVGVAPAAKANVVSIIRGDSPNDNRLEAITDLACLLTPDMTPDRFMMRVSLERSGPR